MTAITALNTIRGVARTAAFKLGKYSPHILLAGGIIGVVAGAVLACKATTKVNDILSETKETMDTIHKATADGEIGGKEYTPEDGKNDTKIVFTQTAVKFIKLYGPSVAVGVLSIAAILGAHHILNTRYLAAAAAFAMSDKSFKEYRSRVIRKFGEKADEEIRLGAHDMTPEEAEGIEKRTGIKPGENDKIIHPIHSDYIFRFDESSTAYDKNIDFNRCFLTLQQGLLNNKLHARGYTDMFGYYHPGYLFLNEVLDELQLPRTEAGQFVGWTENGPDGYVDFRMKLNSHEDRNGNVRDYYLLDLNCEGNIIDKVFNTKIKSKDEFTERRKCKCNKKAACEAV